MPENRDNFLKDQFVRLPNAFIPPEPPAAPPPTIEDFVAAIKSDDHPRALELLNNYGIDINQYDSQHLFPIHYLGIYRVSDELFDLVYDNTENVLTPVHLAFDAEIPTQQLIKVGDTVLHIIARCDDDAVVEKFCAKFDGYQDIENEDNETPLSAAISTSNIEVVNFALLRGAKVDGIVAESAEDFLFAKDREVESEEIYRTLASQIGKTTAEIEAKIKQMKEANTKTVEEKELSDKDLSDSDHDSSDNEDPSPSPHGESSEPAVKDSKKRKRE